jgi:hypothetical protein
MESLFNYTEILVAIISVIATTSILFKSYYEIRKNRKDTKLFSPKDFKDESEFVRVKADLETIAGRDLKVETDKTKEEPQEIIQTAFELKQLDNYYSQALSQSRISFWFSILFASIGFVIIIIAGFMYSGKNIESTIVSLISGTIIDSVAALFFVQTRRAQQNMSDFFQKLREDKQYIEAKGLCDSLESTKAKDALKVQLALNFSNIPNSKEIGSEIIKDCLNEK